MILLENIKVSNLGKHCFEIDKLELKPGHLYNLCGANGSGKSTFLKMLCDFYPELTAKWPKRPKGLYLCFSDLQLFPFLSVRENLQFHFERLNSTGLDFNSWSKTIPLNLGQEKKIAQKLSQGEQQLCKFSLSLLFPHELLCFDELFNYLDFEHRQYIFQVLEDLAKKKILMVSSQEKLEIGIELKISGPKLHVLSGSEL